MPLKAFDICKFCFIVFHDWRPELNDQVFTPQRWKQILDLSATLPTPHIIIDTDVIERKYKELKRNFPQAVIHYAVKANPNEKVVRKLAQLGSHFDIASRYELDFVLYLGVTADRIFFGNTIKKEADIRYFYEKGVRTFATDCESDLLKISRAAPGSKVFVRILLSNSTSDSADWPLSKKFGCSPAIASDLLEMCIDCGLEPYGLSFHVGSQQRDIDQWEGAIAMAASVVEKLEKPIKMLNLGGGLPACYELESRPVKDYAAKISSFISYYFPDPDTRPYIVMEPGRSIAADSGVLVAEVITVEKKTHYEDHRWVYLDAGKFNGLIETIDESIKYRITTSIKNEEKCETGPVILAGPTCDSMDIMYEEYKYELPLELKSGDRLYFHSAGAYTSTYASVCFNGFPPIKTYTLE